MYFFIYMYWICVWWIGGKGWKVRMVGCREIYDGVHWGMLKVLCRWVRANACVDSTLGKVMEKAGHVMHNEGLVAKGAAKRAEKAQLEREGEKGPFAN